MKRTKQNKTPSAILAADFHLREDQPFCRTDNHESAQWIKVDFISALQKKYNCPVLLAGDLFHHWKPSPYLLSKTIEHIPDQFWTIYGNHDLPQHSLELVYKCGINTLKQAKRLGVLYECHWGQEPSKDKIDNILISPQFQGKNILVWHVMTYQAKTPWPGCVDPMAGKLLRKYPEYDLILTGHNHKAFVEQYEGRLLVNPGSLTRQFADQINHKPRVYLWYAETNTVEPVYLPIKENVISREHIENKQERDGRIDAFISQLDSEWEAAVSFQENLNRFFSHNEVRDSIKDIVMNAIEK